MSASEPSNPEPHELNPESWAERYRQGRTGWDRGQSSPALSLLLNASGLTSGQILVPGCGHGYEVVDLASRGFQVTAVDFAEEPLTALRGVLTESKLFAELVRGDVFQTRFDHAFDAVYEQTCLCALHPDTWEAYADKAKEWIRPAGWLMAVFMQTGREGGPPFHCDLDAMRALFAKPVWEWVSIPEAISHPVGLEEFAVLLRKNA